MRETVHTSVVHLSRRARPASLSFKEVVAVVSESESVGGIVKKDLGGTVHVELPTAVQYGDNKGWLNFMGGWHFFSEPGGSAAWVKAIGGVGKMEVWLRGLDTTKAYIVSIETGGSGLAGRPSFEVRSSDASPAFVTALPPHQTLLLVIEPDMEMSLVTVEPHHLDSWLFFKATAYQVG